MAARPRKNNVSIPNLYPLYSRKVNKVYWRYKHPMTGKFHSLGTDEAEARAIATEANARLAEQHSRQVLAISDRIATSKGKAITTVTWLERYWKIQEERFASGDIRENTYKQKAKPVALLKERAGMKLISSVDVRDIAQILEEYLSAGQPRMAQVVRSVLIDVFKEAQHYGEVPPGHNPALATKQPRRKITRQRLSLAEWQKIFDIADKKHQYMGNAMLLALVTGQRLGDLSKMKFSDIWDDHLHIEQEKTGSKIAIPLSLRLNAINWSLRDVIARCRDYALSPYLIHFFRATSQAERGAQVKANTLTMNFSKARDLAEIDWGTGTPATFHEQRSLSERLYKVQGIDTQKLLGHKSPNQTARYHDDRGKDWINIII
ncbi:TPA: phage integrase Arm DNA-binding domain-containing protein [Citrobacter freundii]|uniref:Phage integrase Arm DNA-binding domain-containing protein n=1 Tax=Citrobacter freundii TaxID=546 RepID=A0AAP9QE24_CITFR|nr:site-specific integrase [Citrobacter freundii]EBL5610383.1 tyrosine-type recombinase/integrase [Salmonella enterica subsp. enterica serovar Typhimurium]EKV4142345.1 phage integrase Arm DNA-binding domain-containing protein [Citrobacter freundii]QLV31079.1 phage integrase Arm DNA-binding domain-containing protein [Citrobacter freundii]QLW84428.1 phage integrase Arm DNA-binding domain-containing protein [Citrobacter freundii]HCD1460217.1 phage integrase Arm DNA-binding domain-containing prote